MVDFTAGDCVTSSRTAVPWLILRDRKYAASELADRAFHFELDQTLELDRILHRKLADEIINKSVYAQAHGLCFTQAALLHVKDLLGRNLRYAGLVLNGVAGAADGDRRIGISARGGVDKKRVALGVVLAILEMLRHVDEPSISGAAGANRDRFRDDVRRGFVGSVDHSRAGVLVLSIVSQCDREHFAAGLASFQDHAWIFHGQARTDIAV